MSTELWMIIIFVVGYLAIVFEHLIHIDKSASALLTGVSIWAVYVLSGDPTTLSHEFEVGHIPDIAGILLFILGAMTIVEIIDLHDGFQVIVDSIKTTNKRKVLWITGFIAFFLAAIIDSLTTAIVMMALLRKLVHVKEERWMMAGMVVIAANAGGAWSCIGNVPTTLLWIGNQITPFDVVLKNFIPSLICLIIPLSLASFNLKGNFPEKTAKEKSGAISNAQSKFVLIFGLGLLLFVPVLKTTTHLPPFMGMLLGVGVLWLVTDIMHKHKEDDQKKEFSVYKALTRIDVPSVLFFFGILSAVSALEAKGILGELGLWMNDAIGNQNIIVYGIGVLSAIVDNVPLVKACQGMYTLDQFPTNSHFWHFISYCAGTGGSILIIGSAAGVAIMGMEKIDFMWYAKKIGWLALAGYTAGAIVSVLFFS